MANVVPHSTCFFNAVTLCLRRDGVTSHRAGHDWETSAERACEFLDGVGEFLRSADTSALLPQPLELRIVGAEPFRHLDALEKILHCARANKLIGHVWTTGAWAVDADFAAAVLRRLSGTVHAITLHTSADAVTELGLATFDGLLHAIRESRLGAVIECCVGPKSRLPLDLLALEVINSNSSFIRIVPPPLSADEANDDEYFLPSPQEYDRCAERFSFTLLPDGEVYPCVRSIGAAAMRLGSLLEESVADIVRHAAARAPLARLRNEGPAHLASLAALAGRWTPGAKFADSCQFHLNLLAALPSHAIA